MTTPQIQAPAKLNSPDAAEYVGVANSTMDTWRCLGKGPKFFKAGSRVWYLVSELDAWIESRSGNCSSAIEN